MANTKPTGWVGWVYFASAMLLVAGGLQAIAGLVALFKDNYYVVSEKALLAFNYTTWGWLHLALGVLLFAAGVSIMNGNAWGRVVGVFLAVLAAVGNLAFLSAYPLWSIIAVIIDVLVIYALTMHGTEVRD